MRALDPTIAAVRAGLVGIGTAGAIASVSGIPFAEIGGVIAALAVLIRELRITWVEYKCRQEKAATEAENVAP